MKTRCVHESSVEGHFAGTLAPSDEHSLREHLVSCDACRESYRRHLLLERMVPAALGAKERIGRGLGLLPSPKPASSRSALYAALAVAAALILVIGLRGVRFGANTGDGEAGFTPRGLPVEGARVLVYRVTRNEEPRLAGETILRHDELGFAYENPDRKPYLMIFGVDEHRHVFWFYPEWTNPSEDPVSISADVTTGVHQLHEAISQDFDGNLLDVHGVFSDAPLSVHAVETLVAGAPPTAKTFVTGAIETSSRFSVGP